MLSLSATEGKPVLRLLRPIYLMGILSFFKEVLTQ